MGQKVVTVLERLNHRIDAANSLLCVGLDSNIERIPERFHNEPHPQFSFNRWIIEQTHEYVCAYKPNTAFYEARGADSWAELQMTMDYLNNNHPDIFTICDAKRADIGNTNTGYATAVFDRLGFDAITLHPYLGSEALRPFLEREDKASIILCRTSNPNSDELQGINVDSQPLWERVIERVRDEWNTQNNCMLVVGATYPEDLRRARQLAGNIPFLVPGVGAQGGDAATVLQMGADSNGRGLIVNSSRGVIFSDDPAEAAGQLQAVLQPRQ
ncbi:MAG: orotidine-5'-phosphate decarboxylase [Chloroflexota bacterium]